MSTIKPYVHEPDNRGSLTLARLKTKNSFFLNSVTTEKSFAIPSDGGVSPKYVLITPSPGSHFSYQDDTNSNADSLDDPNGGGAIGTQLYITSPTWVKLDEGSTHIHFKSLEQPSYINFEYYS